MSGMRVVIVGGGAAGLSAAYTLKRLGLTATLLEAENRVGGRLAGDSNRRLFRGHGRGLLLLLL